MSHEVLRGALDWDQKGFPGSRQHVLGTRKIGVQVRPESNQEELWLEEDWVSINYDNISR